MPVNFVEFVSTEEVDAAALNSRFQSLDDAIENLVDGDKTLTAPTISSFENGPHDHEDAAGGGQLTLAAVDSTGATSGQVPIADGSGGAAWGSIGQIPVGAVMPYAGSSAPTGYLLCDGQAVSRTTYADLFALISTTYGAGNGTSTFNVPDLRGRFPLGKDNMGGSSANRVTATEADNLGQGSGAETHTLTESEMPAHVHQEQFAPDSSGAQTGLYRHTGSAGSNNKLGASSVQATTSTLELNTTSVGGGAAHNNMPPYVTLNYIIKT